MSDWRACHRFLPFVSAYREKNGCEPEYTSITHRRQQTLDYIWYSGHDLSDETVVKEQEMRSKEDGVGRYSRIRVLDVLQLPTVAEMEAEIGGSPEPCTERVCLPNRPY